MIEAGKQSETYVNAKHQQQKIVRAEKNIQYDIGKIAWT